MVWGKKGALELISSIIYLIEYIDSIIYSSRHNSTNVVGPAIPGLRAVPDLVPIHPILPPTVHIHL